MFILILMCIY
jgi:hypothetical protein